MMIFISFFLVSHLNIFLFFKALDALVGELSASLEDDMKELELDEKKNLFPK